MLYESHLSVLRPSASKTSTFFKIVIVGGIAATTSDHYNLNLYILKKQAGVELGFPVWKASVQLLGFDK